MAKEMQLFFSYGHDHNDKIVDRLKTDLEHRGHKVWIDKRELKPLTESWRREILKGVMDSGSIIAFLSNYSTREESVCLDELRIAVCVKRANIKTILLEPEHKVKQPIMVSDIQWLDMSNWEEMSNKGKEAFEEWYNEKFTILSKAIESDNTLKFNGEIQSLKNRLKPYLNTDKEYGLLKKVLYGRAWLDKEIERWQDYEIKSKSFVIYGKPGSGKSAFSAHYAHFHSNVYGCFLCEWNNEYSINPNKLICTIAFQLATKLSDYREFLLREMQEEDANLYEMKPETLFGFLLSYPLNNQVDGNRETCIIVVDGLDEAEVNGDNPVARVFANCVEQMPRWIKFIFTSRRELSVTQYLSSHRTIDIIDDMPDKYQDIRSYLMDTLKEELNQLSNRLELINKICELSEGIFLYAVLFVEEVKKGTINLQNIHNMPKGLNAFYMLSMKRKFSTATDFNNVRTFLELLCVADKIPEDFIIGICQYRKHIYFNKLKIFGSWVVRYKEGNHYYVGMSHKSVSDWFRNYEQSGIFFIENQAGALSLAHHCRTEIEYQEATHQFTHWYDYMRNHIGGYYIQSEKYDELEDFLISRKHDLSPFWKEWNRIPDYWNHNKLIKTFWESRSKIDFLYQLQREGNTGLILWIFERINKQYGIEKIERELFSIYMDIVHLSGDCHKAVEIADRYLKTYEIEDILKDDFLSTVYVRRLHHAIFFKPLKEILNEAKVIYSQVSEHYPKAYNEIVFIIGGNIYMMLGEWNEALTWLKKSDNYATMHHHETFHKRNMRKMGDCLCHEKRYEEAERVILDGLSNKKKINSRYDVYLMGALANLYTCLNNDDEALYIYETILKYATTNGIQSWIAHSLLGIGNMHLKISNWREAKEYAQRAKSVYKRMKLEWGIIMCDALIAICDSKLRNAFIGDECSEQIQRAAKMNYGSCIESIMAICEGESNYMKLFFI